MKTVSLIQGTPEWMAHRAQHFNASDAPAMMGCSPHMTRSELLHMKKTGIAPEVDPATQRRFDDGHRFEALARPLAEKIIGEELYAVTGTNGELSASFDGLTLLEDTAFEHKSLNESLRYTPWDEGNGYHLPLHYQVQMEHQLMVSGAERVLFMATKWGSADELKEERHCWYASDPALRAKILAGWKQFAADLVNFAPVEVVEKPVAAPVTALPAVSVQVTGEIAVRDNFALFETALRDFIDNRLIREPATDQEFADLDLQIKALKNAESALDAAEAQMLAQVSTVDTIKRTKDMLHKLARDNRLMAEKLLEARKLAIKGEIVAGGVAALAKHIRELNAAMPGDYMPVVPADFGGVVKGKRTVESLRDAVNTELARAKIAANEIATRIGVNIKHLQDKAGAHKFLFLDTPTIVLKAPDDLQALVSNRINEHQRQEAAKEEAQRERIRAEEQAKLQREADEKRRSEEAEAARVAQAAIAVAATPAPATAPEVKTYDNGAPMFSTTTFKDNGEPIMLTPEGKRSVFCDLNDDMTDASEKPTLKLGEINARLALLAVTADDLAELGFAATLERGSKLYRPSDFPKICAAIVRHVQAIAQGVAA